MKNKISLYFLVSMYCVFSFSQETDNYLTLRPEGEKGKDAIIIDYKKCRRTNYEPSKLFTASSIVIKGGGTQNIRALVEFDLTELPAGAKVTGAHLDLYAWDLDQVSLRHFANKVNSNACVLQRITTPWKENKVNWKNQPETTEENQVILPLSYDLTASYTHIDVTKLIQDMINNPNAGFGIMMKLVEEDPYKKMNFCSSDHDNKYKRPRLSITYVLK